jgi:hypothetical protein
MNVVIGLVLQAPGHHFRSCVAEIIDHSVVGSNDKVSGAHRLHTSHPSRRPV